jgi:hypothetical protein
MWQTYYTDATPNVVADTNGRIRTGVLPYQNDNWWVDQLMIHAPSGNRRWGTIFEAYCPDGVLVATGW